jgi:hypothetical protein
MNLISGGAKRVLPQAVFASQSSYRAYHWYRPRPGLPRMVGGLQALQMLARNLFLQIISCTEYFTPYGAVFHK